MKLWRDFNPSMMPRPRLIWNFEGSTNVLVGMQVSDGYSDPVLSVSVEVDLGEAQAERLSDFLMDAGALICLVIGHDYEPVSYPKNTPQNPRDHLYFDREQCHRCLDLRPRKDV